MIFNFRDNEDLRVAVGAVIIINNEGVVASIPPGTFMFNTDTGYHEFLVKNELGSAWDVDEETHELVTQSDIIEGAPFRVFYELTEERLSAELELYNAFKE